MNPKSVLLLSALSVASAAHAATVTQWNFNSGNNTPSVGTGTIALVGGTTSTYAGGLASGATVAGQALNTTMYAAQGAGNKTRGVSFLSSTTGYKNVVLDYDVRHSNTSANVSTVQVTTDGTNWSDVQTFTIVPTTTTGDAFYHRTVDLSSVANVANNAKFGFRVLATYGSATGYLASRSTSTYGSAGTLRFDNVTISGTAQAVPEPTTIAALGLGAVAMLRRRRKA